VAYPAVGKSYHASYCVGGKVLPCWEKSHHGSYHVRGKVTLWLTQLEKKVTVQALEEKVPCELPCWGTKSPCKLTCWRKSYPVSYHVGGKVTLSGNKNHRVSCPAEDKNKCELPCWEKSCLVGETINIATLLGTKRSPCQLLCWGNSYCVSYPVAGKKLQC